MKINEVKEFSIANEKSFIDDIRKVLGIENKPLPQIKIVPIINGNPKILGAASGGYNKPRVVELKKSVVFHEETFKRVIAHELCHVAAQQLVWEPKVFDLEKIIRTAVSDKKNFDNVTEHKVKQLLAKFKKLVSEVIKSGETHDKVFQQFANKVNAKYGKTFVTTTSDKSYIVRD